MANLLQSVVNLHSSTRTNCEESRLYDHHSALTHRQNRKLKIWQFFVHATAHMTANYNVRHRRLNMTGDIAPPPCVPSWCGQGQL